MTTNRTLLTAVFLFACTPPGGQPPATADGAPDDDAAVTPDASPPDATPAITCAIPAARSIGGVCGSEYSCELPADGSPDLFMFCLSGGSPVWPQNGYCTAFFCAADADCGAGNVCGSLPDGFGGTFTACLPACCDGVDPGMACSEDRLCAQSLFGDPLGGVSACVPGTPQVADGAPCDEFADCDADSVCRRDPFQFPGGQCATLQCDTGADCAAGGDGRCIELSTGNICVDACSSDFDCRYLEGYKCMDRDDGHGTFCQRAQPGDPCGSLFDCGDLGDPWMCRLSSDYPGGYCTVEDCTIGDASTCPVSSFCVQMQDEAATFCADDCETVGSGECGTGYKCAQIRPPGVSGDGTRNVCVPEDGTITSPL